MGNIGLSKVFPAFNTTYDVFLGGSYDPTTTWRENIAIPMLQQHKISFYNPPVNTSLSVQHTNNAKILLFVIDNQTRGIMSIAEAAYYIGMKRHIVLVIEDVNDEVNLIHKCEFKDLNRGRAFIRNLAKEHNIHVSPTVADAIKHITQQIKLLS
jgi:hypothetical protein